ncbi:hypothetical protein GCM10022221_48430 [Actinocorallia aurea]
MLTESRREEFHEAVAEHRLKTSASRGDKPLLVLGGLLLAVGMVGAFVAYSASLSQSDLRDVASSQVLATAFLVTAVAGAAIYVSASVARVLRLWLLRQIIEGREQAERISAALSAEQD